MRIKESGYMGKPEASDQNRAPREGKREREREIDWDTGGRRVRVYCFITWPEHGQSAVMISDAILNALLARRGWPGQAQNSTRNMLPRKSRRPFILTRCY